MPDPEQDFIEQMGLLKEDEGFSRIGGRLFGYLLLYGGPFSLDELADALQVSKGSISTNARQLERLGFAERTGRPGDRRDYYTIAPSAPERIFQSARRRISRMRDLLVEGEGDLPERVDGHERIRRMRRFHDFLLDEMEATMERWKAGPDGKAADGEEG